MSLGQRFKAVAAFAVLGMGLYIAVDRRDDIHSWVQEQERTNRTLHTVNGITHS
jgi:hypothetical protein